MIQLYFIRTAERRLNFWQQIWQYQYIAVLWTAATQFYNLEYPEDNRVLQIPNIIFCFAWLIIMLIVPPITFGYVGKRYFRLDYYEYCYWF